MKSKELSATIAILQRMVADPELKPWQRKNLRKGLRELKRFKSKGKLEPEKVFRVTKLIADTLQEERLLSTSR